MQKREAQNLLIVFIICVQRKSIDQQQQKIGLFFLFLVIITLAKGFFFIN